jgi:hypothetical protein
VLARALGRIALPSSHMFPGDNAISVLDFFGAMELGAHSSPSRDTTVTIVNIYSSSELYPSLPNPSQINESGGLLGDTHILWRVSK